MKDSPSGNDSLEKPVWKSQSGKGGMAKVVWQAPSNRRCRIEPTGAQCHLLPLSLRFLIANWLTRNEKLFVRENYRSILPKPLRPAPARAVASETGRPQSARHTGFVPPFRSTGQQSFGHAMDAPDHLRD